MDLDDALPTFVAESRELLDEMESALLTLESTADADAVNAIFRAAHTIKGSSGLFGLDAVVAFTHVAESVLDRVRGGALPVTPDLVKLLLSCCDHMRRLTDEVSAGRRGDDASVREAGEPLLAGLRALLDGGGCAEGAAATPAPAAPAGKPATWHLSLRFGTGVLRNGMDPLAFIRYLGTMGRVTAIETVVDALPAADAMDPECCYLGFELAFETAADKAQIESVFEFVLDDCTLHLLPPASRVEDFVALMDVLQEPPAKLGEMLVRCGSVTAHELERALAQQQASAEPAPRLGEILVAQQAVPQQVLQAALERQGRGREAKAREAQSVRVDADKLDRLIDLVGELIIAQATAALAARRSADLDLHEAHSTLASLVQEVRDSALQLRMVKIGGTFGRFQRVVHDVSREIGKDIALVVDGEDTELDKTVVEKIADPLTHLVRNAMDHGIEPAAARLAAGKPERGTVRLNAYHDSGSIVIEVGDDGGGLKRDRILAKAVERGLVEPGRSLTDSEIYALIFEPGFSTAEQVTNLSGRGVGMDVVRRNITALRGTVAIDSRPGVGTTVTVRLPLTLAIIDGFQVAVGNSVFVLPLEAVEECVEFGPGTGHDYAELRGQVLPFIRLHELFGIDRQPGARQSIVVVRQGAQRFGVIVDRLLGEAQTVIKPLARMFAHLQGISGSSILGSGDVALILDVATLMQRALQPRCAPPAGLQPAIAA